MQSSKFFVHGAVLHFSTNSKKIYREIHKDFGLFETDENLKIAAKVKIIETERKFPIEIPEYAIRESVLPPNSAMYFLSDQRFIEEKHKRIIRADFKKNEIVGYSIPPYDISQFTRFLLKWTLIKVLESKNIFFIHGSGVVKDDNALFFVGPSGFGKTSALLTFLQGGYKMITDDTILLSNDEILPLHIRSMIHKDMLQRFPRLKKGLNEDSTNVSQQGWLIDLGDIFPVEKERISPSKLFYVYAWNSTETKIEEISGKEMLSRLFYTYLNEMNKTIWFGQNKNKVMKKLFPSYSSLVENVDCYKVFAGTDPSEFLKTIEVIVR